MKNNSKKTNKPSINKASKPSPKQAKPLKPSKRNQSSVESAERIQKVLARGGLGSRREIERWIEEGRFKVNGATIKLGAQLKPGDFLQLNGRVVNWEKYSQQPTRVLVYYKSTGELVTRKDPEGRNNIFSRLPRLPVGRWIAVGRLDINTSGLLLVTNNGELANKLMHPSSQIDREYSVRVLGEVSDETLETLKQGVELDDGMAHFDDIQFVGGEGANKWYSVVVSEGRNRLVRRLWESQSIQVSRLMRVRYGPAFLPDNLKAHSYYELNEKELAQLEQYVGLVAEPKKP